MPRGGSPTRHALAVFTIAREQDRFDKWLQDLGQLSQISQDPLFRAVMDNPKLSVEEKLGLLPDKLSDGPPWADIPKGTQCKVPKDCDDGLGCTTEACPNGYCKVTLNADRCLFGGTLTCYKVGDKKPGDPCQQCRPNTSHPLCVQQILNQSRQQFCKTSNRNTRSWLFGA